MDAIAAGRATKDEVVTTSRNLLAERAGGAHASFRRGEGCAGRRRGRRRLRGQVPQVRQGPAAARDARRRAAMFIGCAGWPDCDVTYPLAAGQDRGGGGAVPCLRHAAGEGHGVPLQAAHRVHRPELLDEPRARRGGGQVPYLQGGQGKTANLIAQKNPRTLKRFIRCENYDECETGYPLPQYGRLDGHGRGMRTLRRAPGDRHHQHAGPWKLCPNFNCPGKAERAGEEGRERRPRRGKARRKEGPCQKGPGQEAGREEALGSVGRCEKPR